MSQLNNNINQPKQSRKRSLQLNSSQEIEALRLENRQLRDSIILQQKSIDIYIKQKKLLQFKLKSSQKQIHSLNEEVDHLRKTLSDLNNKYSLADQTTQKSNYSHKELEKTMSRKGSHQIQDIVVESKQENIVQIPQIKNTNNSKLMNCLRKMTSLEYRQARPQYLLNRLDSCSEPILRTLKDYRWSCQLTPGFMSKQKLQEGGRVGQNLQRKKSYLQKVRDNETIQ